MVRFDFGRFGFHHLFLIVGRNRRFHESFLRLQEPNGEVVHECGRRSETDGMISAYHIPPTTFFFCICSFGVCARARILITKD